MSSSSPTGRNRLRAALAAVAFLPVFAPSPAPSGSLPVIAALSGGGETALVADLGAPAGDRTVTVTRGGVREEARLEPVMSDGLNLALVVDTSTDGAAALPAWLSAAARFALEAPGSARSVVITAGDPATAVIAPQQGPLAVVRALDGIRPSGDRDTVAALTLATTQFPQAAPGRRLVVLYTTAPGADRQEAESLGARLRESGTILVVVGTSDANRFWTDTAAATGGFFAPAGNPVVVPALDQVQTTLRGRYLIRFRTPPSLPADVNVRVESPDLTLTGNAVVTGSDAGGGDRWVIVAWAAGITVIVVVAVALVAAGRRSRRPAAPVKASPGALSGLPSGATPGAPGGTPSGIPPGALPGAPPGFAPGSTLGSASGSTLGSASGPAPGSAPGSEPGAPPPIARGRASVPRRDPNL
ncbi:hypothetical protein HH310_32930 [Actinoplanes sp. TBRC 11911]|uniref:hypothetical protein n=1 Tax=Actinoplanes sp. TBRC 11911 TaxID=2729386 RepID=UPI00145E9FD9|nr:hypothetical protein [Actinoplanes sp. TBRC 11911]NMO55974.1 hypothetical protein [Actinoplanes sp. TBRC 11911]